MTKRGPTDTDRQNGEGEGDVEVVNAAGERKKASLPRRLMAGARDTLSMTDQQPPWPAQLADDGDEPDRAAEFERARQAALADPDPTLVTGNSDVAVPDGPPQATLVAYRQQQADNTRRVADQTALRTGQLVTMDQHARARVYDIGRLVALAALGNEAAAQLAGDGWANVNPSLIGEFEREIAGWRADRGIAP